MVLHLFALGLWALAFLAMSLGTIYAWRRIRRRSAHTYGKDELGISILKPLKGVDPGLAQNLETFFLLDYLQYELLFCLESASDPALSVVRDLVAAYPHISARIFVSDREVGPNPKINNMLGGYAAAKYDTVMISDSNVRVSSNLLHELLRHWNERTGVLTAVVAGQNGQGVGGRLETMYLNTFFARWMWIAEGVGKASVLGKTMMFRKSDAEKFGGFRALGRYIAEDYQAGCAMQRLGLEIVVAAAPVTQYVGRHGFLDFWKRHVRWGRIRKSQVFSLYALEALQAAIPSGALGAYAVSELFGFSALGFFVVHLMLWAIADLALNARLEGSFRWESLLVWAIRELLALPLWLHSVSGRAIDWRGRRFNVLPGGLLEGWTDERPETRAFDGLTWNLRHSMRAGGSPALPIALASA